MDWLAGPAAAKAGRLLRALLCLILLSPVASTAPAMALTVEAVPGDGMLVYGQTGNTSPQFRPYVNADNDLLSPQALPPGDAGSRFVIRTSPLRQELIAGYQDTLGILRVMCFDGDAWYQEFSVASTDSGGTKPFDIAYETATGDVMVIWGTDDAGSNELAYRTRAGLAGCGTAWPAANNIDAQQTAGEVGWVKAAWDRRAGSDLIAVAWADETNLSAKIWSGTTWQSEPNAPLETSLEYTNSVGDQMAFDLEYESLSGDVMVTWGNSVGEDGINGVRYSTCAGGTFACSWTAPVTPPSFLDDASHVDLAANPVSDEMVFASLGRSEKDLQAGYWNGAAWTNTPNLDTTGNTPNPKQQKVAVGWLVNGAISRSIITYSDNAETVLSWYVGTAGSFAVQSDFVTAPATTVNQRMFDIQTDPLNHARLMLGIGDSDNNLVMQRLTMSGGGAFTWQAVDGGVLAAGTLAQASPPASASWAYAFMRHTNIRTSTGVAVGIDPLLSFTIGARAAACNGITPSAESVVSATSVNFGHVASGANRIAAQDLTVGTNTGAGYKVLMKYSAPMTSAGGHTIADLAGATNSVPIVFSSPGTPAFGYTTDDSALSNVGNGPARFTSPAARWGALTTSGAEIAGAAGPANQTNCVGYQLGVSSTTPAGNYSSSVSFTVVPSF